MAGTKNSNRRKRKYAGRESITDKNRTNHQRQEEARRARLMRRTQSLIGQHVTIRVKDHAKPLVGTVLEVVDKKHGDYPHEARRHVGRYLRIRTAVGELLASRHRVKPTKE